MTSPLATTWTHVKRRAIHKGMHAPEHCPFTESEVPTTCPALGIPIHLPGTMPAPLHEHVASPDRIDPSPDAGYAKPNVVWISALANRLKNDATPQESLRIAAYNYRESAKRGLVAKDVIQELIDQVHSVLEFLPMNMRHQCLEQAVSDVESALGHTTWLDAHPNGLEEEFPPVVQAQRLAHQMDSDECTFACFLRERPEEAKRIIETGTVGPQQLALCDRILATPRAHPDLKTLAKVQRKRDLCAAEVQGSL